MTTLLFTPFITDISKYIHTGENEIQVTITPAKYNEFVGEVNNGNKF